MIQLKAYNNVTKTQQFWIDLYETEPIKLTLSIEDITSADATSTYSKTFKVPGTRNNEAFFKESFDVDGTLFDVTVKKPAEILVDGAEFKQGQIRLQRVYLNTDLDRYDYELIFLGETRDFSSKIGDKGLCELQLPDLIGGEDGGSLGPDDIIQSWTAYPETSSLTNGLHNGNIIYPLIDHGNTYVNSPNGDQARIATDGANRFTQPGHPLTVDRFKPMIRAKRVWDKIFEDAGYTYTSSFITSDLFHQMYISAFGNTATVGWDSAVSSPNSSNVMYAANATNNTSQIGPILLNGAIDDPGGNVDISVFNLVSSPYDGIPFTYYEVPAAGTYEIRAECYYLGYQENSDYQPTPVYDSLYLYSIPAGGGIPVQLTASFSGFQETLQFSTTLTTGVTPGFDVGDRIFISLGDLFTSGYVNNFYSDDFIFEVTSAPGEFNPASSLECTYKQIDFIKDILTAFRLVLSPDPNNVQNFIVEPWQTYINSGQLYDWSDKLVEDKDFVIEPVFYSQSSEIDFKFTKDGDYANVFHELAYKEPYGYLQFNANNDLLIGKREIKLTGIAPTILLNIEGTTPANNFNIPQLHVHAQEDNETQHLPIKPKTRLLFYNGMQPASSTWFFNGQGYVEYPLVSPYQVWPIVPQTLNLNWANDVQYWGITPGLNQNGSTLYSNYWSRYINFLYGKYSRRVTAFFILNNVDLNTFSFDDTIFINGTYYRPEKIIDVEIGAYTQVKVQLLTSNDFRPAIIPFQTLLECTAVGVGGACQGSDGSINVTTNGTPGFTWELSNGQSGAALTGATPGAAPYTFTISNVAVGTYTLNVEDSLGRTKQLTITVPVSSAPPIVGTVISKTNASDCNTCDGSVQTASTIPGAICTWNDGVIASTRSNLCPGLYTFIYTTLTGCVSDPVDVEIECEAQPGDVWRFYRASQDCQQIFNETRHIFFATGTAPSLGSYYDLALIGGGSVKGCWTPIDIVQQNADAIIVSSYNSCESCNNIPIPTVNWLLQNCVTSTTVVVPGQPGLAIGQSWTLVGRKGCWVIQGQTDAIEDATLATGPYIDCEDCSGIPTMRNYIIYRCDGGDPSVGQFPSSIVIGNIVRMSDDFCYEVIELTTDPAFLNMVSGPYSSCIECEGITPVDICVTNYGASMTPCFGGSADDYMEGYIDLSDITPVEAQFTLKVFYIPGTPFGDCNTTITNEIDLTVTVEVGQSQGLLTCPQAPFIDFAGATICSVQFISGTYPLCATPPLGCVEYTIGGYDIGETTYLDCDGIEQVAYYNGPAASGYDATSFCATSILSYYGSEPIVNGNQCTPDPGLCTSWTISNNSSLKISWRGLVCGTAIETGGNVNAFTSVITPCLIDGTLEYTGAPTIGINAIC